MSPAGMGTGADRRMPLMHTAHGAGPGRSQTGHTVGSSMRRTYAGGLTLSPVASAAMRRLVFLPPWEEVRRRLPRLLIGLVLCGVAFSLPIRAGLGVDPWNVLHLGVSRHTGIPVGTVSVLVGLVVLAGWIPLRERLGVGTIANTIIIGVVIDIVLPRLPHAHTMAGRWAMLLLGAALAGPGVGLYIGARLGPGPRDGIMTGFAKRGHSVRVVRTAIELSALLVGWLLGGTIGIGTVVFAVTIGPNVHFWLERLDMGEHPAATDPTAAITTAD